MSVQVVENLSSDVSVDVAQSRLSLLRSELAATTAVTLTIIPDWVAAKGSGASSPS